MKYKCPQPLPHPDWSHAPTRGLPPTTCPFPHHWLLCPHQWQTGAIHEPSELLRAPTSFPSLPWPSTNVPDLHPRLSRIQPPSTPHGSPATCPTSWCQWGDHRWLRLGLDHLMNHSWHQPKAWWWILATGEEQSPAILPKPVYRYIASFCSLCQRRHRKMLPRIILFSSSSFVSLLVHYYSNYIIIIIIGYILPSLLPSYPGLCPPFARLKSSGLKMRPW